MSWLTFSPIPRLRPRGLAAPLAGLSLAVAAAIALNAHPGSGIVVDAQQQVYFVDTGQGVWKIDAQGELTLIHTVAYHWMALDEIGHFAKSEGLGEFDRGSFERVTPAGALPALIISSDYPIAVGVDGALYYVPYNPNGPRELVRRTPQGQRSVFATLPTDSSPKPMLWVNGVTNGPDGFLYVTDNDSIHRIDRNGNVRPFRDSISSPECSDPLPDTPKPPYLRGLAVAADGTIYAAANGCRALLRISAQGRSEIVVRSEPPWSPTGVAISGNDIYVLEYFHIPADDRQAWIPRVRKISPDGTLRTLATITRQPN